MSWFCFIDKRNKTLQRIKEKQNKPPKCLSLIRIIAEESITKAPNAFFLFITATLFYYILINTVKFSQGHSAAPAARCPIPRTFAIS